MGQDGAVSTSLVESARSAYLVLATGSGARVTDTHPFGMGRGFLALALLFGGAFAVMVLIGHLAHRGDDRRR
jgi:hypothetical protein